MGSEVKGPRLPARWWTWPANYVKVELPLGAWLGGLRGPWCAADRGPWLEWLVVAVAPERLN